MKKIVRISLIAGVLLASVQPSQAELLDRIVAVVNDDVVLQSEFENEFRGVIARLRSQSRQLPPQDQIAQQVLEQLIVEKVQEQRAERVGIKIPDQMVNQMLQNIAQRNQIPVTQLPAKLASDGINYSEFRDDLRKQIASQQLMQREIGSEIQVSESEIDRVLEQGQNSQAYQLNHILIAVKSDAPAETIKRKQELALDLAKRINNGEDFSKLAIAHSNGNNALSGGDLGWREPSQVPSLFVSIVNKLEKGQTSEPIRSPSGFHLIKVNDIRSISEQSLPAEMVQQYRVRHILIRSDNLRSDFEIENKLKGLRNEIISGKDFSDIARTNSEDPGSAAQGGDLGWSAPDIYAPAFATAVTTTPLNTVSEPFKSQFGWHIIEVQDQREENMANERLRNKARNALREQKFEEESLLWRQRIRDEAYVDYRL